MHSLFITDEGWVGDGRAWKLGNRALCLFIIAKKMSWRAAIHLFMRILYFTTRDKQVSIEGG